MSVKMTEVPFEIIGLDHIVLRVRDMKLMVNFYCEVLGCIPEREVEELGLVQLRAGSSLIDLVDCLKELGLRGGPAAIPSIKGGSMDHFCLRIQDFNKKQLITHLISAGVQLDEFGMRYGADGIGPSIYVYDPEENMIELKG